METFILVLMVLLAHGALMILLLTYPKRAALAWWFYLPSLAIAWLAFVLYEFIYIPRRTAQIRSIRGVRWLWKVKASTALKIQRLGLGGDQIVLNARKEESNFYRVRDYQMDAKGRYDEYGRDCIVKSVITS